MALAAWTFSSCTGTGEGGGSTPGFRQARNKATDALSDVWLPVDDIPADPGHDWPFYSPADATCYLIRYSDTPSGTPGTVITGWEDLDANPGLGAVLCP